MDQWSEDRCDESAEESEAFYSGERGGEAIRFNPRETNEKTVFQGNLKGSIQNIQVQILRETEVKAEEINSH